MDYAINIYKGNDFIFGCTMPSCKEESAVKEYERIISDKTLMGGTFDDCDFIVLNAIDRNDNVTQLRCSRM